MGTPKDFCGAKLLWMVRPPPYVRNKTPGGHYCLGSAKHAQHHLEQNHLEHCYSGPGSVLNFVLHLICVTCTDRQAKSCFLCRLSGMVVINPPGQASRVFKIMMSSFPCSSSICLMQMPPTLVISAFC